MFQIQVDPDKGVVRQVVVLRDSLCGCAHHVAENLVGVPVKDAEQKAAIMHHHFPCRATMNLDPDYGDGLMNVSGEILRREVRGQIEPFLRKSPYATRDRVQANVRFDRPISNSPRR